MIPFPLLLFSFLFLSLLLLLPQLIFLSFCIYYSHIYIIADIAQKIIYILTLSKHVITIFTHITYSKHLNTPQITHETFNYYKCVI